MKFASGDGGFKRGQPAVDPEDMQIPQCATSPEPERPRCWTPRQSKSDNPAESVLNIGIRRLFGQAERGGEGSATGVIAESLFACEGRGTCS